MSNAWSLNVPETPSAEFLDALDVAEPSPAGAPASEVSDVKAAVEYAFEALDTPENAGKSFKANVHVQSEPHVSVVVKVGDSAASWN